MNRTIKDATVKRFHDDPNDQFRSRLADFINAHNLGRRFKTLKGPAVTGAKPRARRCGIVRHNDQRGQISAGFRSVHSAEVRIFSKPARGLTPAKFGVSPWERKTL